MKKQDYHTSVTTKVRAKEAFENITKVSGWWTSSFKGSAKKVNDEFSVTFGKTRVAFKVVEAVPHKKIVWEVTDCYLDWLKDKKEWKGTKLLWDISEKSGSTTIAMTHLGLVPGIECYNDCVAGWNQYVNDSLPKLISTGKGVVFEGSRG